MAHSLWRRVSRKDSLQGKYPRTRCKKKARVSLPISRPLRLSRILRSDDGTNREEAISLRRALLWVLVWVALLVGVALYFKYARLLTPLLA